jgi:Domain of unknown function (DUF6777)
LLEAGTAVFLNRYGEPVVKCYCGNPLTPPELLTQPVYTGPLWASFTTVNITIIESSPKPINTYTLYDPNTGTLFTRTPGLDGHDGPYTTGPTQPLTPVTPTTPSQQPTTGGTGSTPQAQTHVAENPAVYLTPNPVVQGDTVTRSVSADHCQPARRRRRALSAHRRRCRRGSVHVLQCGRKCPTGDV